MVFIYQRFCPIRFLAFAAGARSDTVPFTLRVILLNSSTPVSMNRDGTSPLVAAPAMGLLLYYL